MRVPISAIAAALQAVRRGRYGLLATISISCVERAATRFGAASHLASTPQSVCVTVVTQRMHLLRLSGSAFASHLRFISFQ